jgi:hypothetical protein
VFNEQTGRMGLEQRFDRWQSRGRQLLDAFAQGYGVRACVE